MFTTNALLTADLAANQLNVIYNDVLDERLANNWQVDERTEIGDQHNRHQIMMANVHNLAVTFDWIQGRMVEAFAFLTGNEGDKYVRNLYQVRIAIDDMIVGAHYNDLTIGDVVGADALAELLKAVEVQTRIEVLEKLTADCNYTMEEATQIMELIWGFVACGLIGKDTDNLAYGNDVLILNRIYQRPTTLVNTVELTINAAATALNALL